MVSIGDVMCCCLLVVGGGTVGAGPQSVSLRYQVEIRVDFCVSGV